MKEWNGIHIQLECSEYPKYFFFVLLQHDMINIRNNGLFVERSLSFGHFEQCKNVLTFLFVMGEKKEENKNLKSSYWLQIFLTKKMFQMKITRRESDKAFKKFQHFSFELFFCHFHITPQSYHTFDAKSKQRPTNLYLITIYRRQKLYLILNIFFLTTYYKIHQINKMTHINEINRNEKMKEEEEDKRKKNNYKKKSYYKYSSAS